MTTPAIERSGCLQQLKPTSGRLSTTLSPLWASVVFDFWVHRLSKCRKRDWGTTEGCNALEGTMAASSPVFAAEASASKPTIFETITPVSFARSRVRRLPSRPFYDLRFPVDLCLPCCGPQRPFPPTCCHIAIQPFSNILAAYTSILLALANDCFLWCTAVGPRTPISLSAEEHCSDILPRTRFLAGEKNNIRAP